MIKKILTVLVIMGLAVGLYFGLRLLQESQDTRRKATTEKIYFDFHTEPVDISTLNIGDSLRVYLIGNIPGELGVGIANMQFLYDATKLNLKSVNNITVNSGFSTALQGKDFDDTGGRAYALMFVDKDEPQLKGALADPTDPLISFTFEVMALGDADISFDKTFDQGKIVGVVDGGTNVEFELVNGDGDDLSIVYTLGGGGTPAPTNTGVPPTPTPTDDGTPKLSFDFTFAGVREGSKCVENKGVIVTVLGGGARKEYDVQATATDKENSRNETVFRVSNLAIADFNDPRGLSVFVKGAKHLQVKFGVDGQEKYYNVSGGQLDFEPGKVFDFSEYSLLAGDVNRDGTVDAIDFVEIKKRAADFVTIEEGYDNQFDLDGSCQVNTIDLAILVQSLNEKYDQVY